MVKKVLLILMPVLLLASQPSLVSSTKLVSDANRSYSPNREFSVLTEYSQGNSEFVPFERFTLQDKSGATIYSKSKTTHTLLDVADNGVVVGIDGDGPISGRAKLHFYAPQGVERGTAEIGFLSGRAFAVPFPLGEGKGEGSYCVNDGRNGLRVFTLQGKERYNLGKCNSFAVSGDGKAIALATDDAVSVFHPIFNPQSSIYNLQSSIRIPLSSPFVRQMKFSADGTLLGIADRKRLALHRTSDVSLVFEYIEQQPERNFISLDIAPDNSLVVATLDEDRGRGSSDRHQRGFIYGFDPQGTRIWQNEISYTNWNAYVPQVNFGPVRTFRVLTAEATLEYQY